MGTTRAEAVRPSVMWPRPSARGYLRTLLIKNLQKKGLHVFNNKSKNRLFLNILLLLILIFVHLPIYGNQTNDWGVKFGLSFSNQTYNYKLFDIERHFDNYVGLNIDIFNNTLHSDHIILISQLSYIQKGCTEEFFSTYVDPSSPQGYANGEKIKLVNRIDYISIAVLSKIVIDIKKIKPYVFFGPRFEYPVGIKSLSATIYNHIKNSWGFSIGFGGEFPFVFSNRMLVEFQYSPDLNEIYKTEALSIRKSSYEVKFGVIF